MPIRPIDIRRKEFRNGFRGYDANQVDDFLDTVADEFERTYNENQRVREEITSLRDRLQQFEDLEGSIRAALVHAEQAANDLRRSANQEAEDLRASARREADYTVRDAQNRSHQMLADSASRVERVQDSYEALQDAKRSFGNDFRHLLKTYMDMMESMEVSSARDIEAALRDRLDTESIAVVREAAAAERQEEPEQPAFGTADVADEQDPADVEDPGATGRIEPETAAVVEPEATEPELGEALGPVSAGEPIDEQDTQILRPDDAASPGPLADEPEQPAVDEQSSAADTEQPATEETAADPSSRDTTDDGATAEPETEASGEVEQQETSLAEESRSEEFFDRENTSSEGGDSRISRASRFLRRRE